MGSRTSASTILAVRSSDHGPASTSPSGCIGALSRISLLELEAVLVGGLLEASIRYCPAIHYPETMASLADSLDREHAALKTRR
jgi:hypothetical protein